MRKHTGFYIFFGATLLVFLGSLITMRKGFLFGDSLVQFYPWLKVYAESIKNLQFPFWTRYMHSGFPLMAEGQVGGFYPLNIVMFFLMPFKLAYNYSVVLHFILAGVFTYFYTRKLGAGEWGGSLAALLFCFGSAYAGCFYNIVTLKTLAWFPLVLLLIERFLDTSDIIVSTEIASSPAFGEAPRNDEDAVIARRSRSNLKYIMACGAIAGMQFLAGFFQMAVYSFIFYIIYLLYGFRFKGITLAKRIFAILIFTVFTLIVAFPQVLLTYHLAQASGRAHLSLSFALWRSFPPQFFLGIFFPYWTGFMGQHLYISVLGIFLLIYAILHAKACPQIRALILIAAIAILAALGKYNPLYVAALKLTGFYSFRNPSKFLFFALFAGSALSGFGFSKLFDQPDKRLLKSAARIFTVISAASLVIFFVSKFILYNFKDKITLLLENYVKKYIFGKPYHKYDLKTYIDKAHSVYTAIAKGTDLGNIFVIFSVIFVALGILTSIYILVKPNKIKVLKLPVFALIFLDIYVYSFYGAGFGGQIKPFESLKPAHKKILAIIKADNELFRIAPFDLLDEKMPDWARPNANIIQEIDSIGAYSPLVEKDYIDKLSSLEVIDDSLGMLSPSVQALAEKYTLLKLLNVKYIVSGRELNYEFLNRISSDEGIYLYQLTGYLPRIFFTYQIGQEIVEGPVEYLKVIEYRSGLAIVELSTQRDGFLVFSENYYPGWEAFIDENRADIIPVEEIVQAVKVTKGKHRVVFKFKPKFF